MSYVRLEFPVLVQKIGDGQTSNYHLKPLLVPSPAVVDRRFEPAVRKLRDALALRLKGYELHRENIDFLLWYAFNPTLKFYTQSIVKTIGWQVFNGKVSVAEFELKGRTFVCLPAFRHFMFLAKTSPSDRTSISHKIETTVVKLLKEKIKETSETEDFDAYYTTKGEFVTTIAQTVKVKQGTFRIEQERDFSFFANINENSDFDGGVEIEKVGSDLLKRYPDQLLRTFHREPLVNRLYNALYQSENTPLVLVGKEGVGKHSLLHEAIFRYRREYPNKNIEQLQSIWHLDPTRIIAGMSIVGMWQKRFEAILNFALNRRAELMKTYTADKIVFDNSIALQRIGKSAQNSMTLSDVLKPYLEKRKLQVILIATPEQWKIVQEKSRSFADLFQVLRMEEVDYETAAKIVLEQRKQLELAYSGSISIQAIHRLFTIQRNYLKQKALPGSVMKLLRQLVTKYKATPIDLPEVREEFQNFSGLEEAIFDTSYSFEKQEVKKKIGAELVGQPEAVETLANVIHTVKAKLNNPDKPMGSFLFIGPTGVGKTQAAKVLCKYLKGDEKHLMRFDMNEYIDEGAVHRLIGDYYNPEGQLTGKVRYNPFGVLLLDEIEKAHPKVHDLLLQVLDDGRLTDSVGRTVDFTNTVIIMTSNVGAKAVSSQLGFGQSTANDAAIYSKSVRDKFRPEFINRIDRIVVFQPLELVHILNIARLQIKELLRRDGFVRRSTILNISREALEWVAKRGYDARMGGRALKRQIERDLTTLSAEQLVSTYSDQPILFDIFYDGQKLVPKIRTLTFVDTIEEEWLPETPDERQGRRFYGQLLRQIERIEQQISRLENQEEQAELIVVGSNSGNDLNWQHYDFKNRLFEVKDRVQTMLLGFRDRNFDEAPAIPLRLKRIKGSSTVYDYGGDKAYRAMVKDQLFQQEGIQEIIEYYRHAAAQFDSLSTEFLDNFLNVFLLKLQSKGFLNGQTERIRFRIQSGITGIGQAQVAYLQQHYEKVLTFLDIRFTKETETESLVAEGYSLQELFHGEQGIHLFQVVQGSMIPVKLIVENLDSPLNETRDLQVVRVYSETTLTDVRTGFSNNIFITPQEFKLLLYAGVAKDLRNNYKV
ncbi:MAG: AAA family ATPase [Bacteroidota bacterium]